MPMLRLDQASRHTAKIFGLLMAVLCPVSAVFAANGGIGGAPAVVMQGLAIAPKSGIHVHPISAAVNVPRTIFYVDTRVTGCTSQIFSFDTSTMDTQNLISIRHDVTPGICGLRPPYYPTYKAYTVIPSKVGKLTVRATRNNQIDMVDAAVTATPTARSMRNVNGMWFDPTTNGSGISMHHSRASDVVFGTWFLFNIDGSARWYTMQNAFWRGDGDILEGLLIAVSGNCPDVSLVACPAKGNVRTLPLGTYDPAISYPADGPFLDAVIARFTFTSDTSARAEVIDFAGNILFVSQLVRLPL